MFKTTNVKNGPFKNCHGIDIAFRSALTYVYISTPNKYSV